MTDVYILSITLVCITRHVNINYGQDLSILYIVRFIWYKRLTK